MNLWLCCVTWRSNDPMNTVLVKTPPSQTSTLNAAESSPFLDDSGPQARRAVSS